MNFKFGLQNLFNQKGAMRNAGATKKNKDKEAKETNED